MLRNRPALIRSSNAHGRCRTRTMSCTGSSLRTQNKRKQRNASDLESEMKTKRSLPRTPLPRPHLPFSLHLRLHLPLGLLLPLPLGAGELVRLALVALALVGLDGRHRLVNFGAWTALLLLRLLLLRNVRVALAATFTPCMMRLMSWWSFGSCLDTIGWPVPCSQVISLTRRISAGRSG